MENEEAMVSVSMAGNSFTATSSGHDNDSNSQTHVESPAVSKQICAKFATQTIIIGEVKGYLVHEVSQKEFYIQLTSDTELLEDVMQKVVDLSGTSSQVVNPTVGQACIAKFSEDGNWYRAEITECRDGGALVLFVDYGNSSVTEGKDLLEISSELSNIPPLAIRCCLTVEDPSKSLTEWAAGKLYTNRI